MCRSRGFDDQSHVAFFMEQIAHARKRYQTDHRSPEQDIAGSRINNKGKFIEKVKLLCERVGEH